MLCRKFNNKLNEYRHKLILPDVILKKIISIYEELSKDDFLLFRSFTQNNNEFHTQFAYLTLCTKTNNLAVRESRQSKLLCILQSTSLKYKNIFNRKKIFFLTMHANLIIEPNAVAICEQQDKNQIFIDKTRMSEASRRPKTVEQRTTFEDAAHRKKVDCMSRYR